MRTHGNPPTWESSPSLRKSKQLRVGVGPFLSQRSDTVWHELWNADLFVTDSGPFPTAKGESGSSHQRPLLLRTAAGEALQ
jgi:hypothetical protein